MVLMLMAVTTSFLFVQFQGVATAKEVTNARESSVKLEMRVRGLELRNIQGIEQLKNVQESINEVKEGQRDNNKLLRQLLQQSTGRPIND
jgi:hypothetical protein